MAQQVVTIEDLQIFRVQLLEDIKNIIRQKPDGSEKKWLRSADVRQVLGISAGTLQNFRIKGVLPSVKIGGIHYYSVELVEGLFKQKT